MTSKPWEKFRVGKQSEKPTWTEPNCRPLQYVDHVAHIPIALRISEDRQLRADLVFDQSKLNTQRIRVVWLSPNDWFQGSRYGNVCLRFDWASLVAGKNAYWVESIAYGVTACRILITDFDHSATLLTYDPTTGDGPWWAKTPNEHYWNGNCCLEVMYEGDISLSAAKSLSFVKHHPSYCNIDPRACTYLDRDEQAAGAIFVALLTSRGVGSGVSRLFLENGEANLALKTSVHYLIFRLSATKVDTWGTVGSSDDVALPLARAVLALFGNPGRMEEMISLIGQFKSSKALCKSALKAIAHAMDVSNPKLLLLE